MWIFGLFILFLAISLLSLVISFIVTTVTYFTSKSKAKRKRRIFLALISPFIVIYTASFFMLTGSFILSEIKKVDVGFFDSWYVPLGNNCQLLFIDIPEQAYIENDKQVVVSDLFQIEQQGNLILGKTYENKFFLYNTRSKELKNDLTEDELRLLNLNRSPKLMNAIDFYAIKRSELLRDWLIIIAICSMSISILLLYVIRKLILKDYDFITQYLKEQRL